MVPQSRVSELFECKANDTSPYMQFVTGVKNATPANTHSSDVMERLRSVHSPIPAVTHVDGSARVQTVDLKTHVKLHRLIESFESETGVPVLINTSFNVRGEPIACTPEDAYRCFLRSEMDILVMENCVLDKSQQPVHDSGPSLQNLQ